ncbi:restriction endonuclease subunit S [Herbaspirillum sp. GW103]|uniref:restriction endonuclease subunit S n=1 Tax=Herbaspirillum sp. GW103 TaxID=1175306 RepID=UPI00192B17EB
MPPLPEQQKIAAILTAVDDKLDIIARQIEATQNPSHYYVDSSCGVRAFRSQNVRENS